MWSSSSAWTLSVEKIARRTRPGRSGASHSKLTSGDDSNSLASNSIFAHEHKWGGSPTYCEPQDSLVVVDPVANSG